MEKEPPNVMIGEIYYLSLPKEVTYTLPSDGFPGFGALVIKSIPVFSHGVTLTTQQAGLRSSEARTSPRPMPADQCQCSTQNITIFPALHLRIGQLRVGHAIPRFCWSSQSIKQSMLLDWFLE